MLERGERRSRFTGAATRAQAAIVAASTPGPGRRANLEPAVSAFLSCRQYAPLASGWLGAAQAVGAGEYAALRLLREYEQKPDEELPETTLRAAFWKLLDKTVIASLMGDRDIVHFPGTAAGVTGRADAVRHILTTHYADMRRAYPVAYDDANVTPTNVAALRNALNIPGAVWGAPPAIAAGPGRGQLSAPTGWSGGKSTHGALVRVTLAGDGTVESVVTRSRGVTLLGSAQGHHMTAHVVFERQVARALTGQTLADARDRLVALVDEMYDLPTCPPLANGGRTLPPAADRYGVFAAAMPEFVRVRAVAVAAADDPARYEAIVDLAAQYLCIRNALPLVATLRGATADANAEATWVNRLDGYERAPSVVITPDSLATFLWNLLCVPNVLEMYEDMTAAEIRQDAPGAPPLPLTRLRYLLEVHRRSVARAWPLAYAAAGFGTRAVMEALLRPSGIDLDAAEYPQLAADAGFTGGATPARDDYTPPAVRRADGQAWVGSGSEDSDDEDELARKKKKAKR
jgi:hypothetical protein